MQLRQQLGMPPNILVVTFHFHGKAQIRHDWDDLFVLRHGNHNIRIAHGAQLRLGVQRFQLAAFQRHIVNAVLFKGFGDSHHLLHLPLTTHEGSAVSLEQLLHDLFLLRDTAAHRAVIQQGIHMMFTEKRVGLCQGKAIRQGIGFSGDGAFQ